MQQQPFLPDYVDRLVEVNVIEKASGKVFVTGVGTLTSYTYTEERVTFKFVGDRDPSYYDTKQYKAVVVVLR